MKGLTAVLKGKKQGKISFLISVIQSHSYLLSATYPQYRITILRLKGYLSLYQVLKAESFNQKTKKWYKRLISKQKIIVK